MLAADSIGGHRPPLQGTDRIPDCVCRLGPLGAHFWSYPKIFCAIAFLASELLRLSASAGLDPSNGVSDEFRAVLEIELAADVRTMDHDGSDAEAKL